MSDGDINNTELLEQSWFIDLDWYRLNRRSFTTLAQRSLCPKCYKRLQVKTGEIAAAGLFKAIKGCCSKEPGFISGRLSLLESMFRLFLANGNQPLNLEALVGQLRKWRGEGQHRPAAGVVSRLLASDQYYGLRPVQK